MSSTRTSSFRRACSPRSQGARRSSSPPTARTSRTHGVTARLGRRRRSRCGARTRSWPSPPGCSNASPRWCPRPGQELGDRYAASTCSCSVRAMRARLAPRWAGRRMDWIPLPRVAQRAQERAPPRACVRAARRGELAFVGDGPLRSALAGRARIHLAGAVAHDEVATWIAAADVVCQPSLMEPFGLSTLEALASGRSVVATRVGGPPEFVPPGAGVARRSDRRRFGARRSRRGGAPTPAEPRALGAPPRRTTSGGRRSGWRSFCFALQLIEIGQPDLDERPDRLLEAGLPGRLERCLVARAHLVEGHALLEPVVAGHEQVLDLRVRVVGLGVHRREGSAGTILRRWSRSLLSPRC